MEWNTSPKNKDKSTKQSKNLTREGRRNKRRINECLRSHTHALFGGLRSSYDHLCVTDFSQRDCLFCSLVGDVAWNGGGPSPSFHTARGVSWSWPHAIACSAPSHLPGALAPAEKLPSLRVGRSFFPGGGGGEKRGHPITGRLLPASLWTRPSSQKATPAEGVVIVFHPGLQGRSIYLGVWRNPRTSRGKRGENV